MYCTCCGLCCKKLQTIILPAEYRYLDNGDGVCRFLRDNLCSIYDKRPIICDSKKLYDLLYRAKFNTYEEYEDYLRKCCYQIQNGGENEGLCENS